MTSSASPRATNPTSATLTNLNLYDLAKWKPLSADRAMEELVAMHTSSGSLNVEVQTEELEDGRTRLSYLADVVERSPAHRVTTEPYMLIMVDNSDTRSRPTAFVRTDVDLAEPEDDADSTN